MDYYLKLLTPGESKPLKLATFICERCGKKFQKEFWFIKKGRRFCSHACRTQDPLKALLSRVVKQANGCWDYTGNLDMGGYGQIKVAKKHWLAHRLMWTLWNQKRIPKGLVVRHSCIGNRKCINPDHLLVGTQKDNIHDMIRQGRFRKGGRPEVRMFTDDQVREIRMIRKPASKGERLKPTYKELGRKYGIKGAAIWQIVNFKTYKEVK